MKLNNWQQIMIKENPNGKRDLKTKKFKIANYPKKLLFQVISTLNPIFFKKENLMNFKKAKSAL